LEDRLVPSAGALDPTFGTGGVVTTDLGSNADRVAAVVGQADGKLVAAGVMQDTNGASEFALARYQANGALDPAFGSGGVVKTSVTRYGARIAAVTLQPDGKIVVAGSATVSGKGDGAIVVARYTTGGSLDTAFGGGQGFVITNLSSGEDDANAVVVQPDGRILVGGNTPNRTNDDFCLVRYTPSGALDKTFGRGGVVTTDFLSVEPAGTAPANSNDYVKDLMLLPNGQIVAAGAADYHFAAARYNANGSLDGTYGSGGKALVAASDVTNISAVMQPDGKVVFAGAGKVDGQAVGAFDTVVARLTAGGALDAAFGSGGLVIYGIPTTATRSYQEDAQRVTLDASGNVIVVADQGINDAATNALLSSNLVVLRFTPTGALDAGFGSGGVATATVSGYDYASAGDVLVQADGSIVVGGSATKGPSDDFALLRFLG
jgi:uncharacterized delta-60 repeat protein